MKKQEVIEMLCKVCERVSTEVFKNEIPADCFCGDNPISKDKTFQFHPEVVAFIVNAVDEKINRKSNIRRIQHG